MAHKKSPAKKRTPLSKYAALVKAKASHCAGRGTAASARTAATAYIKDAVKKGNKTKAQATDTAKRVLSKACKVKASIASKKKIKINESVVVNTGGKNYKGTIVPGSTHGAYWKKLDAYLVQFKNGTRQYIPSKYIK